MIKLFNETDTTFSTNGDVVLNPTYAVVHKEDNGEYYLDLEINLTEETKTIESQPGTNITINGYTQITADGNKEVEITDILGNTIQNGTPTPTSPILIDNVSNIQQIEVCKKNIFDISKITESKYLSGANGQENNSQSSNVSDYIYVIPSQTYILSFSNGALLSSNDRAICFYDKNRTFISSVAYYPTALSVSITTPNNATYLRFTYDKESYDLQLEKGETISSYENYIGNTYEINLGVENLFNKNNINKLNAYFENNGTIIANNYNRVFYILCSPNTTYYLEQGTSSLSNHLFQVATTDVLPQAGVSVYNFQAINTGTALYKTNSTAKYIVIRIRSGDDVTTFWDGVKIIKGFKNTTLTESPIELNKIGIYQDKIYKENGKWFLHKETGKLKIDTSSITLRSNYTNIDYACIAKPLDYLGYNSYNGKEVYFTHAQYDPTNASNYAWDSTYRIDKINARASTTQLWIGFTKNTSLDSIKALLKDSYIIYPLSTATETEITDSILIDQLEIIRLYTGENNISITSVDLVGAFDLHYDFVTGGEISINDYITSNKIIVANTPTGDQAFRITNIDKTRRKIKLIAKHITYDSENYVIQDSYVVDKTCNQALDHLNDATDNESPFTMTSDITTINSYRCIRRSLWEAIQVVLERWGGHLTRNNWNIGVMDSIGADNGVVVRYAKNLKNINVQYDWSLVVTKILPVGQDGILLDEIYLYSDIQYDIPYTKVVHFNQDIDESLYYDENGNLDEEAYIEALKADLRSQANAYLQVHNIPQVNYELNANLEKITDIGDTIQVIDERLGIDLLTNLISYDYDCILERYKTLEFGNFRKNLTNLTTYIDKQTNQIVEDNIGETKVTLQNELQTATSQIWGVLGNSYVLIEGDKILIVDSLPKETAHNVIMLNSAGIGFSQTGINGTFSTALTIDGTFNTNNVNVINFTADLIKGGVLKLGSNINQNGILEVYDEANNLIAQLDKNGLRMNAVNGAYVLINQSVGFAGYDRNDNPIYWVSEDEFHMKKSVVEEEITLVDKMRIIPITIYDNGTIVNDGIGFVSTL